MLRCLGPSVLSEYYYVEKYLGLTYIRQFPCGKHEGINYELICIFKMS